VIIWAVFYYYLNVSHTNTFYSWLNTLYLSMDANFKLKQKERGFSDPPLSNGLMFMVADVKLRKHLADCLKKKLTSDVRVPVIFFPS